MQALGVAEKRRERSDVMVTVSSVEFSILALLRIDIVALGVSACGRRFMACHEW